MKKLLVLSFLSFVLAGCAEQTNTIENPCAEFSLTNFPAGVKYVGVPSPVNIQSHPAGSEFQSMLRAGSKRPPNFAGSYTITSRSCGKNCRQHAVIDARTGRIIFLPLKSQFGISFSLDSRVIILNPPDNIPNVRSDVRTEYWLLEGGDGDTALEFSLACEAKLKREP